MCLLLAGLALRLAALPLPGTEDVNVWKVWSYNASQDVTAVYGVGGDPPHRRLLEYQGQYTTVDYPPVALYVLGVAGRVYGALAPGYPNNWHLLAAIKIPGLCAGMALTWLLYRTVRRLTGSTAGARVAALSYWLNPATILNGEVLGYLDPLVMLPAIAAFVLASGTGYAHAHDLSIGGGEDEPPPGAAAARVSPIARDRRGAIRGALGAGACLGVAMLTKPQAVLIAPALALAVWRTHGPRARLGAAVAWGATSALIVLPYAVVGALPNMWLAFGSFYARRDILSGNAANVWWIANYLSRVYHMLDERGWEAFFVPVARIMAVSTFIDQGMPNPRPFATALAAIVCGAMLWHLRRACDLALHAALAAFTVHAFFVLAVGVHEHHQILAVPLLALAAALRPRLRPTFIAVSLICALNMNLFYGISRGWGWAVPRMLTPIDLSVLLSIANIAALVWHARLLSREAARASRAVPA